MTRVDDQFVKKLDDMGEDKTGLFCFTEVTRSIENGTLDIFSVPVGRGNPRFSRPLY